MRIPSLHRRQVLTAVGAALLLAGLGLWSWPRERITIGVEGRQVVFLQGPRLAAIPYTHGDALAVRIAAVEPVKDGFRYDLRYMAYGPGQHDLRDYLVNERQQPATDLPQLTVSITALLADNESGQLQETPLTPIDLQTNYRWGMSLLWSVWALLLVPLLLYGRKRRSQCVAVPLPTIPERLLSLLEHATQSQLSVEQQTDVEKLLLAYWAGRLQLPPDRLVQTLEELRQHPTAGQHVSRVERWLHCRETGENSNVARELLESLRGEKASE